MIKNEMIRNLLYSFCLHLLFFLLLVFSNRLDYIFNKSIMNLNYLGVDSDFLKDINVTENSNYSDLTLKEKVELYKLTKNNKYDPSKDTTKLYGSNSSRKQTKINNKINNRQPYILYLGPTDYKKYIDKIEKKQEELLEKTKQEEQKKQEELKKQEDLKKQEEEILENKKLDEILSLISDSIDISDNNDKNDINKNDKDIKDNNTKENNETKDNNKNNEKNDLEIIVKSKKEIENNNIINEEDENKNKLLNINPDKIFTKGDLDQIREIIKNEKFGNMSLSLRERINIQNQLISCYKNAIIQTSKPSKVSVSVTINLLSNGIINTKKIKIRIIDDDNKFTEDDYNDSINNAKIALAYCNPIRGLPTIKYFNWQTINFIFDAINK